MCAVQGGVTISKCFDSGVVVVYAGFTYDNRYRCGRCCYGCLVHSVLFLTQDVLWLPGSKWTSHALKVVIVAYV